MCFLIVYNFTVNVKQVGPLWYQLQGLKESELK